jgi:UDP-galactopyranose mutase
MPFARNEATRFISPTKTPEYLAGGRAVASTSIRDVVHPYADLGLVHIGDSPDEFIAAVTRALEEDVVDLRKRADAFLSGISWEQTWAAMQRLIDPIVASRLPVRPAGDRVPTSAPGATHAVSDRHLVGALAGGREA